VIKRISQNFIRTLDDHGGKANRSDVRKGSPTGTGNPSIPLLMDW
jgi:hypothetical protein